MLSAKGNSEMIMLSLVLYKKGRLSDDDSADTLDDLDGPAESNLKTSEEQRSLASAISDMVLSGEARFAFLFISSSNSVLLFFLFFYLIEQVEFFWLLWTCYTFTEDSHNTGNFMPYSFRIVC